MGSVGDCYDNAMAESFFATLECELLDRTTLPTHAAARAAVFEYIEVFYKWDSQCVTSLCAGIPR